MPETPSRWGLTVPLAGVSLPDHRELVQRAEAAGYDGIWSGETANGTDGFTPLALAAAWTESVRLVTGVVNPFTRGPGLLAQTAAAMQEASGGRFVLGIGASSDVIVERFNGLEFDKPLSHVRECVERMRPVLSVPAQRGFGGLKLERPVGEPVPIVLAALRGKMLRLAAEVADGAFTNFLPLSGAPRVAAELREGLQAAGRDGEDFELACRFFCFSAPADQALPMARAFFSAYISVPVYAEFFRWLGYAEEIDPMVAAYESGDRAGAAELAPERLIRETFIFGSPEEQRERLAEFAAAGITTPVLMPVAGPAELPTFIDALGPR